MITFWTINQRHINPLSEQPATCAALALWPPALNDENTKPNNDNPYTKALLFYSTPRTAVNHTQAEDTIPDAF